MFHNISEKITDTLVKNGSIPAENKELYSYGFRQLFLILVNISTIFLIGLVFGEFWKTVLFSIGYLPIRSFAGGYHANTPTTCYFFSILMMLAFIIIIKVVSISTLPLIIMLLFSIITIILLSPTQDKNKPLDDLEKKVYKRKTLVLLSIETVFVIIFILINLLNTAFCLVLSLVSLSIILIIGRLKNRILTLTKAV